MLVLPTPLIGKLLNSRYRALGWFVSPLAIFIIHYLFYMEFENNDFPFNGSNFMFCYYYLGMALGNRIIKLKLKPSSDGGIAYV